MTLLNHDDLDAILQALEHYEIHLRNAIREDAGKNDPVYKPGLRVFRATERWMAAVTKKVERMRTEMEREERRNV